ncbi:unnamed protein product (mitochondrion) [Plasmodiophora brassicae]|uniref:Uncharacterized protein n=1 Tax=Plasmodiophora brassicae TaxID=37360 RepID=A0A3P3Y9E7_PLABS|nr:unnamed protein product [Plasmodiophora brassicae]
MFTKGDQVSFSCSDLGPACACPVLLTQPDNWVHLASSSGLSAKNCPTSTCDILGRRARHAAGAEPKRRRLSSSSIRELVRLARPELALLSAGGAALVIGTGTQLAIPVGFGRLVDMTAKEVLDRAQSPALSIPHLSDVMQSEWIPSSLESLSLAIGGLFLVGAVANVARVQLFSVASARLVQRLRQRLFGKLLRQPISYFDSHRSGDLVTRLSNDVLVMGDALTGDSLASGARNALQLVGTLAIMTYISPQLSSVLIGIGPAIAVSGFFYGRYVKRISRSAQESLGAASATAEERLSLIRTVKAFAREDFEAEKYAERVHEVYRWNIKAATANSLFSGGTNLVGNASLLAVLGYGSFLVKQGLLSAGDLTSFILYTFNFGISIIGLSKFYGDFMRGYGASDRVMNLLNQSTSETELSGGVIPSSIEGEIVFSNVVFRYPSRPTKIILDGISMAIKPQSIMALVGHSGCGKSTIAALLLKLYNVTSGVITLDGTSLDQIDTHWLRENIGIVSQEPDLFHGTIEENIRYGSLTASRDDIVDSAKAANAHEFINGFPDGYATSIGQGGVDLSGGQKQRLAIARAILKNPRLLILDEATSALDSRSERLINEALNRVMATRTTIVIAHRVSTFQTAHQIVLLRDGRVLAIAPHTTLLHDTTEAGDYYH